MIEMVAALEFPPYRRAFTSSSALSLVVINDGDPGEWQADIH